jgi:hypothetical protein
MRAFHMRDLGLRRPTIEIATLLVGLVAVGATQAQAAPVMRIETLRAFSAGAWARRFQRDWNAGSPDAARKKL